MTFAAPSWPAIFLPLNTLPGSWHWPVEPWLRCETDTPWLARKPPKLWRFIAPAKPLPIDTPDTSTNWPGTKWAAVISRPTSTMQSALTRNSASRRLGSTCALA